MKPETKVPQIWLLNGDHDVLVPQRNSRTVLEMMRWKKKTLGWDCLEEELDWRNPSSLKEHTSKVLFWLPQKPQRLLRVLSYFISSKHLSSPRRIHAICAKIAPVST